MNENKVCFIICVNDDLFFEECVQYINWLEVPDGIEIELLEIRDAVSMTAGYNEGMNSSDAKYKIYMHQDVFFRNKFLIYDLLNIFNSNSQIGMIGLVGTPVIPENGIVWDTERVQFGKESIPWEEYRYSLEKDGMWDVEAIDGLFMATQYDIPWREDLFDGWDYYDISHSCEMRRCGYHVVVPVQNQAWYIHDDKVLMSLWEHGRYRKIFLKEYKGKMISTIRKKSKCRICGKEEENNFYNVKEMFLGTKENFSYFECKHCQCMQIFEFPVEIEHYYGKNYYSFEQKNIEELDFPKEIKFEQKILDVGCGSGEWLIQKAKEGYGCLYGCDPFIESDIKYGKRIEIKKGTISDMGGTFDFINFGDSFEHMEDPLEELVEVKRLMSKEGRCQISIPIYPNIAVETFGVNWYQWDAPRHFFLHSKKSMEYLCEQAGLTIEHIEYNSDIGQFVISFIYELGIPMVQIPDNAGGVFPQEELRKFKEYTDFANKNSVGDHAVFTLKHKTYDKE